LRTFCQADHYSTGTHTLPGNDSQNAALLALLLALVPVLFGPALRSMMVVMFFLLLLVSVKKTGLLF
jgi:hypothetical protein